MYNNESSNVSNNEIDKRINVSEITNISTLGDDSTAAG